MPAGGELTQVSSSGARPCAVLPAPQRRRLGFNAVIQPAVKLRVACRMSCVCCRLPAAIAAARALPARALAPLSHILKNGLRFVQGLAKPASFRFCPGRRWDQHTGLDGRRDYSAAWAVASAPVAHQRLPRHSVPTPPTYKRKAAA